ncbi:hypothetical protein [Mycolicibacterium sp. XJ1819]
MNKIIRVIAGTSVGAAAAFAALSAAGVAAAAPDVVGEPYSEAVAAIEDGGGNARVASRVGGTLDEDECLVTNAWDASFLRIDASDDSEVMLALNCAGGYATATNPGASVASPLGRQARSEAEQEAATAEEQELAAPVTPDE